MKILLVSDVFKYYTSGVAYVVITLADALRAAGHDVKVLSLSNNKESFREGDNYFIGSIPLPLYPNVRQSWVRRHPYLDTLIEWKPEIIHVHSEGSASRFAAEISEKTGTPIVMTLHTNYAQFVFHKHPGAMPVRILFRALISIYYRHAMVITVPSEKGRKLLKSYRIQKPLCVVPNGIRLELFQREVSAEEREAVFAQLGIPDNGKLFVIISRLSAEKNIRELVDAFAHLVEKDREVHLLISGDGPDKENLENRVRELGLEEHVVFTGNIPHEELYRYYKAGIAFLSASTFEMHSLTYLEAMACGLPLICREDSCLMGVLEHGENGYRYQSKKQLVQYCLRLLEHPEVQKKMAAAALKRSHRFGDRSFAKRFVRLYRKVAGLPPETETKATENNVKDAIGK